MDGLPLSKALTAIFIACTASPFTGDRGEVDVRAELSRGTGFQVTQGWAPA